VLVDVEVEARKRKSTGCARTQVAAWKWGLYCCWPALQNILPQKIGFVLWSKHLSSHCVRAPRPRIHRACSLATIPWPLSDCPLNSEGCNPRPLDQFRPTGESAHFRCAALARLSLTLVVMVLCLGATAAGKTEVQQRAAHAAETSPRRPDADTTESMAGLRCNLGGGAKAPETS